MLKNIFIPEKIGSYYIFGKKVVGIEISKNNVRATVVQFSGNKRTIEKIIEQTIAPETEIPFQERASSALKILLQKIKYDAINLSLSCNNAIFLYLTLPIIGLNKIKQIVPFEIESQLPFTLDQAVIDCIITKEYPAEKKSDVLVVIVKKDVIAENLAIIEAAQIKIDKITVDIIELAGLLKYNPKYLEKPLNALIVSDMYSTGIALILDKQIKYIRVIPKGFYSLVKKVSAKLSMDVVEVFERISRFGTEQNDHEKLRQAILQECEEILNEIHLTFIAYKEKTKDTNDVSKIILTGFLSEINGIPELMQEKLHVQTEKFNVNKLVHNGNLIIKVENTIPNTFLPSLAAALESDLTENFNLYVERSLKVQTSLLNKQLIFAGILLLCIFIAIIVNGFLNSRRLTNEIEASEKQAIAALNRRLALDKKRLKRNTLKDTIDVSKTEIAKEESIWFALSSKNRYSFLKYLQELSSRIDRDGIGLQLKKLRIYNVDNETKIDLEGSVKGFPELTIFEQELKSGPFYNVPRMETPNFNITITVNKES
ncbi:pilus assembly protein PilM [Candidatus Dependentiae bacterium]|nr:pilus assembly protein PilM [Candidatus Dependentiae bacterium]